MSVRKNVNRRATHCHRLTVKKATQTIHWENNPLQFIAPTCLCPHYLWTNTYSSNGYSDTARQKSDSSNSQVQVHTMLL